MGEENEWEQKKKNADLQVKSQLIKTIPIFLISIIAPILAWNSFLIPQGEDAGIWFQRSGSIIVLFSVWAEYSLMKVNHLLVVTESGFGSLIHYENKHVAIHRVAQYLAVLIAITGTFIWGYGDFFK